MKKEDMELRTLRHFGLTLYEFMRQKVEKDALYDYEIAKILRVSRGQIGKVRRELGINRSDGFPARFERRYGKESLSQFKNMIEDPAISLADVGNHFGFSREYARQVYREIHGFPYTIAYRRKRQERERMRGKHHNAEQTTELSKEMKPSENDPLAVQGAIERVIERRFMDVRGINCRFRLGSPNPVRQAIGRIISGRLTRA
jgi:hypothetical protein